MPRNQPLRFSGRPGVVRLKSQWASIDVSKRKGGVLVIEIPGAKVKDDAGQPRRSIAIKADSDAGKALLDVMGQDERITIARPAQRIGKDFADIRAKTGLNITAYSFRHQFAAEMKDKFELTRLGLNKWPKLWGIGLQGLNSTMDHEHRRRAGLVCSP